MARLAIPTVAGRRHTEAMHHIPHDLQEAQFPQFDRLEQILIAWPRLFEEPPLGTQPVHVGQGTVTILCESEHWVEHIERHHDQLVANLAPMIDTELRLRVTRLRPVLATPTEMFLARQNIVIFNKLRELGVGF